MLSVMLWRISSMSRTGLGRWWIGRRSPAGVLGDSKADCGGQTRQRERHRSPLIREAGRDRRGQRDHEAAGVGFPVLQKVSPGGKQSEVRTLRTERSDLLRRNVRSSSEQGCLLAAQRLLGSLLGLLGDDRRASVVEVGYRVHTLAGDLGEFHGRGVAEAQRAIKESILKCFEHCRSLSAPGGHEKSNSA
ncbi:MAG: hypothetical protein JWN14_2446 [Chthonomonadales bacterium]|nr:hypothetical protein [Chthonomonadales bacterium]